MILLLHSCTFFKGDGIEVEIENRSMESITNVEFATTERIEKIMIDTIKPNQTIKKFLSMEKNKTDGAYYLSFTRLDGKKEISGGGYYTNGGALNNLILFMVGNDSTIVSFDPK